MRRTSGSNVLLSSVSSVFLCVRLREYPGKVWLCYHALVPCGKACQYGAVLSTFLSRRPCIRPGAHPIYDEQASVFTTLDREVQLKTKNTGSANPLGLKPRAHAISLPSEPSTPCTLQGIQSLKSSTWYVRIRPTREIAVLYSFGVLYGVALRGM